MVDRTILKKIGPPIHAIHGIPSLHPHEIFRCALHIDNALVDKKFSTARPAHATQELQVLGDASLENCLRLLPDSVSAQSLEFLTERKRIRRRPGIWAGTFGRRATLHTDFPFFSDLKMELLFPWAGKDFGDSITQIVRRTGKINRFPFHECLFRGQSTGGLFWRPSTGKSANQTIILKPGAAIMIGDGTTVVMFHHQFMCLLPSNINLGLQQETMPIDRPTHLCRRSVAVGLTTGVSHRVLQLP